MEQFIVFYPHLKEALEVIALLATSAVAFFAYRALQQIDIGLQQIRTTKEVSQTQAKRESFRISAEKCDHFAEAIIPLMKSYLKKKEEGAYKTILSIKVEDLEEGFSFKSNKIGEAISEIQKDNSVFLDLANAIEGFSIYFTCGVAEESVAFRPIASSYCSLVKDLLPILIVCNNHDKTYSHTLGLYQTWNSRIKKEKAELELKKAKKKFEEIKTNRIKTIGTEEC